MNSIQLWLIAMQYYDVASYIYRNYISISYIHVSNKALDLKVTYCRKKYLAGCYGQIIGSINTNKILCKTHSSQRIYFYNDQPTISLAPSMAKALINLDASVHGNQLTKMWPVFKNLYLDKMQLILRIMISDYVYNDIIIKNHNRCSSLVIYKYYAR